LAKREYESFVREESFGTIAEKDYILNGVATSGLAGVIEARDEDA